MLHPLWRHGGEARVEEEDQNDSTDATDGELDLAAHPAHTIHAASHVGEHLQVWAAKLLHSVPRKRGLGAGTLILMAMLLRWIHHWQGHGCRHHLSGRPQ